ncbi:MAG: carbohydrate-binding family 9-like protein [Bullifex sp.]|nr:carbohydrate-binding family 9-like protein [Bullifex sp.]
MKLSNEKTTVKLDSYLWGSRREDTQVLLTLWIHDGNLCFSFSVREKELRRMVWEDQGRVWEDSCMELFISPDRIHYYNFEFSASGALRCGYGTGRSDREPVSDELLKKVKRSVTILENSNKVSRYILEGEIPLRPFGLDVSVLYMNSYKCGDMLKEPHFISLFPIDLPSPDFHQIRFFGEAEVSV